MALFNVTIGSGGPMQRPPARPRGWHWMLLGLLPLLLLVSALGDLGTIAAKLVVLGGFLYACWVVGRWLLHASTLLAGGGAMAQAYPQPPYPPSAYPYPPQPHGYAQAYPPPPPQQPPPQGYGWSPHGEAQRHEG